LQTRQKVHAVEEGGIRTKREMSLIEGSSVCIVKHWCYSRHSFLFLFL
jgi:hypothetical protein